jgi:hypothetical protein
MNELNVFQAAAEVLDEGLAVGTQLSKQANDASKGAEQHPHPDNHQHASWKHREAGRFHDRVAHKYAQTDRKRYIHHMRISLDHEENAMRHHDLGNHGRTP